jgi:2'-5' RNA ligase
MDLIEHYNKLYSDSLPRIKSDSYVVDELIDSPTDNRFGITLLSRPDNAIKTEIQKFLDKIRAIEPQQYFYRNSDLHVTVLSIISCYNGFQLSKIPVEKYVKVIQKSISGLKPFQVEFRGITVSPSCVMVQGFLENDTLNQIRDRLRTNFQKSGLEQSIDKRYAIQTAHSTIFRLREKLKNKEDFIKIIEEYREYYFGTFTVETIEFVFNDWYQREEYVKKIFDFNLK